MAESTVAIARPQFARSQRATFLSLLLGYMGYYLCRQNFSAALTLMHGSLGIDYVVFGLISSAGTLIYALGKITTGALADARGGRLIFLIGLFGSVAATLLFGVSSVVPLFFVAWGINRLFQSMGWGGLVTVLSRWYPRSQYGTAMGFMTISYQLGAALATLFAGWLILMGSGWRGLFFWPALLLAAIGVGVHFFLANSPRDFGYPLPSDSEGPDQPALAPEPELGAQARFRLLYSQPLFLIMCLLSAILTFLRETFSTWMPAYFSEMGASDSGAVFQSAVFPLLGVLGTLAAGFLSDRYLRGSRVPVLAASLAALTFSLLGLQHLGALSSLVPFVSRQVLAVTLVGITGFFLLAPYSMVGGGVIALDFGGRKMAGTAAGMLDGLGYAAATLAGWGVAALVKAGGWSLAFSLMAWLGAASVLLCVLLWGLARSRVQPDSISADPY